MEKTVRKKDRSPRTIKVSPEAREKLIKSFNVTERTLYKALCFESENDLAKKIQYTARKMYGGWIEAAVPEAEILYDTMQNGERLMRQYFNNGAVLEISLSTGRGMIMFRGQKVESIDKVMITQVPELQERAKAM